MSHATAAAVPSSESTNHSHEALLRLGDAFIPAKVRPGSRLSLLVTFAERPPATGTEFGELQLTVADRRLVLGRCRMHAQTSVDGVHGRLVFLDDIYDCHELFADARIKNLKGFFQEVPLVLGQKERIRPEFRSYVADLNYELIVYKRFFNEQDRMLLHEPQVAAEAAQQVLLSTAGKTFFRFMDERLEQLTALVKDFTPEEHEQHGYYFRQQLWPFIMGAEFMKRTNLKPRGYAGDATMMQMLYDNAYVGRYVFHKLLHKHPLEQPAAQAVRNRRVMVPRLLREELSARASGGPVRVLSLACGPARELEEVFTSTDDARRLTVTLLDQDDEALDRARQAVQKIRDRLGVEVRATCVNDSVRTMLRTRDIGQKLGQFDFAYSMGLFDYLTPPVARAVLGKVYELLAPGGVAVIGNYHVSNPNRYYMAYWLDWALYYRTEQEMLEMTARLPGASGSVGFDDTGSQMFLKVRKGAPPA